MFPIRLPIPRLGLILETQPGLKLNQGIWGSLRLNNHVVDDEQLDQQQKSQQESVRSAGRNGNPPVMGCRFKPKSPADL